MYNDMRLTRVYIPRAPQSVPAYIYTRLMSTTGCSRYYIYIYIVFNCLSHYTLLNSIRYNITGEEKKAKQIKDAEQTASTVV